MKTSVSIGTIALLSLSPGLYAGVPLFDADFSGEAGFTHTDSAPIPDGPQSLNVNNFELFYTTEVFTDSTENFFRVSGGVLESSDFGATHGLRSPVLDVSSFPSVRFELTGETVGFDVFNNQGAPEFFEGFYSLDGGAEMSVGRTIDDGSLSFSVEIDTSAATQLEVGLLSFINGAGDGFTITSITAEGIPSPGAVGLLGIAGLAAARRRRR